MRLRHPAVQRDRKPFAWTALESTIARLAMSLYLPANVSGHATSARSVAHAAVHPPARAATALRRLSPRALLGGFLMTRLGPMGITSQRGVKSLELGGGESI